VWVRWVGGDSAGEIPRQIGVDRHGSVEGSADLTGVSMGIEWQDVTRVVSAVCVALVAFGDLSQAQSGSVFSGSFVAVHPGVAPVVVAAPRGVVDATN